MGHQIAVFIKKTALYEVWEINGERFLYLLSKPTSVTLRNWLEREDAQDEAWGYNKTIIRKARAHRTFTAQGETVYNNPELPFETLISRAFKQMDANYLSASHFVVEPFYDTEFGPWVNYDRSDETTMDLKVVTFTRIREDETHVPVASFITVPYLMPEKVFLPLAYIHAIPKKHIQL